MQIWPSWQVPSWSLGSQHPCHWQVFEFFPLPFCVRGNLSHVHPKRETRHPVLVTDVSVGGFLLLLLQWWAVLLKLVGLVSLSTLGKGAVKVVFRKLEPVLVSSMVHEQPLNSHTDWSFAMDVVNSYIALFIFNLGLNYRYTKGTAHNTPCNAMQTMQFPAWFFKTKLDNMSGHAAFYHSLGKERIGNGVGRNCTRPHYSGTQAWAAGQIAWTHAQSQTQNRRW